MGETTEISWADSSFNPWLGCTRVSPACEHCYAETYGHRFGVEWGPGKPRRRTSAANWKKPLAWNRKAEKEGTRPRVFCASLADWLDPEVPAEWLADLLSLIEATPHLDWLLLTKRPELWRERVDAAVGSVDPIGMEDLGFADEWLAGNAPDNVWLGVTVEDQQRADERRPHLLAIPAGVRFVSYEPALGEVDWLRFFSRVDTNGEPSGPECNPDGSPAVGWLICGGESGPGARPMHPEWARSARDACQEAGVAFLFKQWGAWAPGLVLRDDDKREAHAFVDRDGKAHPVVRVGKKKAGRLLDGCAWDELPTPTPGGSQ